MKYIFKETCINVLLSLTMFIMVEELMENYVTTINSFPVSLFIGLVFPFVSLLISHVLTIVDNSWLLNHNIEVNKQINLPKEDRIYLTIIGMLLFIMLLNYLIPSILIVHQDNNIVYLTIRIIIFTSALVIYYYNLRNNLKLKNNLINNIN